ncbi:MAG: amidohydrolase family protein, partial [Acidobacteriota bacterium]
MFDADGHIFEKEGEIFDFLDEPFGSVERLRGSRLFPSGDVWNKTVLDIIDGVQEEKVGNVGPQEWTDFLDQAGLDGTVLYPSAATRIGFVKEIEFAAPLARAYNNWLHGKYLSQSPRLDGIAILPLQSPDEAVVELRRTVKDLGMVGALLPGVGLPKLFGDRDYDAIYETAQELGVPLVIHGGATNMAGLNTFDRAIKARTLTHPFAQIIQLTDILFNGVFDRFPRLRMGFMEAGVGWAVFLLDRMSRSMEMGWSVEAPEMKRSPKETLTGGQLFFHCEMDEELLPYAISVLGDDVLLYASDFPHQAPRYCIEDQRKLLERPDLSEESKAKI